jgi:hypothetical protein
MSTPLASRRSKILYARCRSELGVTGSKDESALLLRTTAASVRPVTRSNQCEKIFIRSGTLNRVGIRGE